MILVTDLHAKYAMLEYTIYRCSKFCKGNAISFKSYHKYSRSKFVKLMNNDLILNSLEEICSYMALEHLLIIVLSYKMILI